MSRQRSPCLMASDAVLADYFFFFTSVLLCFHRSLLEIFFSLFSSPNMMQAAALSLQGERSVLLAWGVWACPGCSDSLGSPDVPRFHVLRSLFQLGARSILPLLSPAVSLSAHAHAHARLRAGLRLTVVWAIPTVTRFECRWPAVSFTRLPSTLGSDCYFITLPGIFAC